MMGLCGLKVEEGGEHKPGANPCDLVPRVSIHRRSSERRRRVGKGRVGKGSRAGKGRERRDGLPSRKHGDINS